MIHVPDRLQLSVVAALTAAVLMSLDQDLGAAVATVVAVACIAEARHRQA